MNMSDYTRTTRRCGFAEFTGDAATAIRKYAEKHGLDDVEAAAEHCFETVSTKEKKGFFRSSTETVVTSIVVTPHHLVWAAAKNDEAPAVLAARLRDIHVQDYETSDMYKLVADTGVNISGPLGDAIRPSAAFIGLGPEQAAAEFREILHSRTSLS